MSDARLQFHRGEAPMGTLTLASYEFPWWSGPFAPTEAFEEVRPAFERLWQSVHGGSDDFDDVWREIASPGLSLRTADGREEWPETMFRLHVHRGTRFRLRCNAPSPQRSAAVERLDDLWAGRERTCPACGHPFRAIKSRGVCPSCSLSFYASHPQNPGDYPWTDVAS